MLGDDAQKDVFMPKIGHISVFLAQFRRSLSSHSSQLKSPTWNALHLDFFPADSAMFFRLRSAQPRLATVGRRFRRWHSRLPEGLLDTNPSAVHLPRPDLALSPRIAIRTRQSLRNFLNICCICYWVIFELFPGKIHHFYDIGALSAQACQGSISLSDVYQKLCCFTADCLEKCYGVIPDLDNNLFIKTKLDQIRAMA